MKFPNGNLAATWGLPRKTGNYHCGVPNNKDYSILSGQLKCIVRLKYEEYGVYGDLIMVVVKAIFCLRKRA